MFYNVFIKKLRTIIDRYDLLLAEAEFRNYNCRYMLFLDNLPRWCFGDYQENEKDRLMILERIQSKIDLKPNYYRNSRYE